MRYRTIVADPPWEYPEGFVGHNRTPGKWSERVEKPLPYPSMSVAISRMSEEVEAMSLVVLTVSRDDFREELDREARERLGVSGTEFANRYHSEGLDITDPTVARLAILLRLAEDTVPPRSRRNHVGNAAGTSAK